MKLRELLQHPEDIVPLARLAYQLKFSKVTSTDPSLSFCYGMLRKVSRSFALVIQRLPDELRDAVCVFYLVLRALDTVEDDMSIPVDDKVPLLRSFHEKIYDREYKCNYGTKHYKTLMQQYPLVTQVFLGLKQKFRDVICDITKQMGNGMADFIEKEVVTVSDYDLYCHYVAGLVGIGLSHLFVASGKEGPQVGSHSELANHMGLFLQKTNIIRDYLEDINEEPAPRMFWPRAIWSKYATSLDEFKAEQNGRQAVACLNDLITDALRHAVQCLQYMSGIKDPQVFQFCGLPQVMAIGTLAECYNNHTVFTGVVKMRRGEVARVTLTLRSMTQLYCYFQHYARVMKDKCSQGAVGDETVKKLTMQRLEELDNICTTAVHKEGITAVDEVGLHWSTRCLLLLLSGVCCAGAWSHQSVRSYAHVGVDGNAGTTTLDAIYMILSIIVLLVCVYICLVGKRW